MLHVGGFPSRLHAAVSRRAFLSAAGAVPFVLGSQLSAGNASPEYGEVKAKSVLDVPDRIPLPLSYSIAQIHAANGRPVYVQRYGRAWTRL